MGAGRGFGMVLHPERRQVAMSKSFNGPVVQVHVRHFEVVSALYFALVTLHRKAVVLRCDQHPPRLDLFHRVIPATVAVGHFHRRSTETEAKKLVAKTNSEGWNSSRRKGANDVRSVGDCLRIAGPVGQEDSVRVL